MGWTIFTAIDLFLGVFLLDLLSTSVPPEKLARLKRVRKIVLLLFFISAAVLLFQVALRYHWIKR